MLKSKEAKILKKDVECTRKIPIREGRPMRLELAAFVSGG